MRVRHWFSGRKLLVVGGLCLLANSALFSANLASLLATGAAVRHALETEQLLGTLLETLLDAETGQRGFLLTGDYDYLAPYYRATSRVSQQLDNLQVAIGSNPIQAEQFAALGPLVAAKLDELAESIALYREDGQSAASELVRKGSGRATMDRIRVAIDAISEVEAQHLQAHQASYRRARQLTFLSVALFGFSIVALFGLVYYNTQRIKKEKQSAERAHVQYSRDLAGTVAELEHERKQITDLNEMASFLQSCHSLEELGNVGGTFLARLFPNLSGGVYLLVPSRNHLRLISAFGAPGLQSNIEPEDCWGLRRGDFHFYGKGSGTPLCQHYSEPEPLEAMCLPLSAHGETVGLFALESRSANAGAAGNVSDGSPASRLADITARHLGLAVANLQLRETLSDQSFRDPLTGAFNRRYFEVVAEKELSQSKRFGRPCAIVMLDVDHFKRFNDVHGHAAGDLVLISVCEYLHRHIRQGDWLFRYGGEEFVLLFRETEAEDALVKADALREGIAELVVRSDDSVLPHVTVSMGIAVLRSHTEQIETVLRRADEALYASKVAGRNQVTLDSSEVPESEIQVQMD